MRTLPILLLSDDRPGHYHLAEGVIAAIARLREVDVTSRRVKRRRLAPARLLRTLVAGGTVSPQRLLSLGYGLDAGALGEAALVISAGGETLPANVAAARALGAANIFVGSTRGMAPEHFSLIVSSYARHADRPRHLVTLKPSAVDPDALGRPASAPRLGPDNPPATAGLLIGGDSGLFTYRDAEWRRLLDFARALSQAWGTRWLLSTSRRTAPAVAEAAFDLAKDKSVVADFIDYKLAGPGTLSRIFGKADMILCTEDSSTMLSEAVWARLPVIGVSPAEHDFKAEERDYRQWLIGNDWCRCLPLAGLDVESVAAALSEIEPLEENPLDRLAGDVQAKLPALFEE